MWSIDELQKVWHLATRLHDGQKYGGSNPDEHIEYMNHIGSVTFEILAAVSRDEKMDADLAIKCAILHDTIEDTAQSYEGIRDLFGESVANGVLALTKNESLGDKKQMMLDSLRRIKEQPKEVWAVKMADRISNLYAPPFYWTNEKKRQYQEEARLIHGELKAGNDYLAKRLEKKIEDYERYIIQVKMSGHKCVATLQLTVLLLSLPAAKTAGNDVPPPCGCYYEQVASLLQNPKFWKVSERLLWMLTIIESKSTPQYAQRIGNPKNRDKLKSKLGIG